MGMLDEGAGNLDALALRQPRRSARRAPRRRRVARRQQRLPVGAEGKPRSVAGAATPTCCASRASTQTEIDRVQATWIAGIKQEKAQPQTARRCACCRRCCTATAIPTRFRSAAAAPRPRSPSLTRDDLVAFQRDWVRPENATLIVVGDTTLAEIVPLLEKHLGDWKGAGAAPAGAAGDRRAAAAEAARLTWSTSPARSRPTSIVGAAGAVDRGCRRDRVRHRQRACSAATSPRAST